MSTSEMWRTNAITLFLMICLNLGLFSLENRVACENQHY